MAQKNFAQMSTKKLNALLETANDEDKVLIEEILNKRNAVGKSPVPAEAVVSTELTPEEQAAINKAEEEAAPAQAEAKPAPTKEKEPKMTDEERKALADELRGTVVNHRCKVVPFNTLEWVDGTVVGIIEEKRTNKILYAVKTDDGRRIVKAYGSELIKIGDEVVEPVKKARGQKKVQLDENGNVISEPTEWTDEAIEEAIKGVIGNVGKTVSYPKTGAMGVAIEGVTETGRIVSLVPNKRQQTILYRIEVDQPDAAEGAPKKYAHKVSSNTDLVIAEELDEIGLKINEGFTSRRYKEATPKVQMTPAEALESAKAAVAKAEEAVAKAQATLEKRKQALEEAQAAFDAASSAETTETAENNEDLM